LVGFAAGVDTSIATYNVQAFWLLYASCYESNTLTLDLSPISVLTQTIYVDSDQIQTFNFVDNNFDCCGVLHFSLEITPQPATSSLISLIDPALAQIKFRRSVDLDDAKVY